MTVRQLDILAKRGNNRGTMAIPEDEPRYGFDPLSRPVIDITLQTSLEDIPDASACEACSSPTQKAFIDHQSSGRDVDIRASRVAGYRCQDPECDITAYSIEGFVEALTIASGILRDRGDTATAGAFERRIGVENRIMAQRTETQQAPDAL